MIESSRSPLYHRHRLPPDVIGYAVWLYFRFPLSLRMVEDILAQRGIIVSHQTIRSWVEKFGRQFAGNIRRRSAGKFGLSGLTLRYPLCHQICRQYKRWTSCAVSRDMIMRNLNMTHVMIVLPYRYFALSDIDVQA